jgi:hypothetical protein
MLGQDCTCRLLSFHLGDVGSRLDSGQLAKSGTASQWTKTFVHINSQILIADILRSIAELRSPSDQCRRERPSYHAIRPETTGELSLEEREVGSSGKRKANIRGLVIG